MSRERALLEKIFANAQSLIDSAHDEAEQCDNPTCDEGLHTYLEVDRVTMAEIEELLLTKECK